MTQHRSPLFVLAAGALLLMGLWRFQPPFTQALYDGCVVGNYLHYNGNPPAQGAQKSSPLLQGMQQTTQVFTPEDTEPQAEMLLPQGTFTIPAGTHAVDVSITPVSPPSIPPSDGAIDGNVYRMAAAGDSGAQLAQVGPATIVLRVATVDDTGTPITHEVPELFDGSHWVHLADANVVGCADEFEGTSPALGDVAMVAIGGLHTSPGPGPCTGTGCGGATASAGVIVVTALVVLFAVSVTVIALSRRGRHRKGARKT